MDGEMLYREKNAVLYGQTARFRLVKYAILIPLFALIYWWWGMNTFLVVLGVAIVLSLSVHFFYRWMTNGWRKAWGGYRPYIPAEEN